MGKNILITGSSSFLGNSLISNDKENIYFTFGNRGSKNFNVQPINNVNDCLLYTSPSPRDGLLSRMPSSA